MFKCEWLKKLLGIKKEGCGHSEQAQTETPAPAAPITDAASTDLDKQEEASLK